MILGVYLGPHLINTEPDQTEHPMTISRRAGFDIHELTIGSGPEQALMMHCSLANARALVPFASGFGDTMTLTGFDLPGHGLSGDWTHDSDYQDRCLAIAETFVTGPLHLIGHSFGATVALRFAAKFPHLVKSMVLFEPVFFHAGLRHRPEISDRYHREHGPFMTALQAGDHAKAAELFLADWGDGTPWNDLPDAFRQSVIKRIPLVGAGVPSLHADPAGLLGPTGLSQVNVPTLLIRGSDSYFVMEPIHTALGDTLPHATDVVIAGAAHMVPITHTRACISAAREFYNGLTFGQNGDL